MNDINSVNLTGRLTRDAECKTTQGGMHILTFSIAVNRSSAGDKEDHVSYVDCKVFGKFAEVLQHVIRKGSPVALTGRLEQERWEAKDGGNRSKTIIVVTQLVNTQPKSSEGRREAPSYPERQPDPIKETRQTSFVPSEEESTQNVPF